ncbi:MAG TPA: hypothetical protein VFS43_02255 [Polyangiaceae bacterium]|nr:hypothetical protein [Polyangiaceae bacterium]
MPPTAKTAPPAPLTPAPRGASAGPAADRPTHAPFAPEACASTADAPTPSELMAALREQGAALRQMQATLEQLVRGLSPSAAPVSGGPTTTTTVADPVGAGFTLSQRALAEALAIPASYVSTLVRAFKLDEDPLYALTVRPGAKRLVNYHPRAIERFRDLVRSPPGPLDQRAQRTLDQVRSRLSEPARAA